MIAKIQTVKALLSQARSVAVLSGAGISAESGIPTFRDTDGLWQQYRPEDLARPEAFFEDPALVWEFYNWRRSLIAAARPNPAHEAIARLDRTVEEFMHVTQNVDGLHRLAGNDRVLELHGNIWRVRCTSCGNEEEDRSELPELPTCKLCGGLLRPAVVWFGEPLPQGILSTAIAAVAAADVLVVAGTSSLVQPAASLAELARRQGAVTVEVNLEPTQATGMMDFALHGKAGEILSQLVM